MQNLHGERFDLMKPGKHVLIHVPRGAQKEHVLLRVEAEARRLGGQCSDMYFHEVNVSGVWAETKNTGAYHFTVANYNRHYGNWIMFGKVELKIAKGRTHEGVDYLNFYVRHLGRAGCGVGGLLGEDDHTEASMPADCAQHVSLVARSPSDSNKYSGSIATADFV